MSDAGQEYGNTNRAFLQSFMARGTMTLKEGQELLAEIFSVAREEEITAEQISKQDFENYVQQANEAISPLDYEILSMQHQIRKERVWALVNSVSDPLTQTATTRTSEEIFYIKRFLDAMFETFNTRRREVMAVSSMQALETKIRKAARQSEDEASTQAVDKGLSGEQVENLLRKLTDEQWLDKSREGFYKLAPRALMELRGWLIDTYNDPDEPGEWQRIKFCVACKEIITVGQRCSDLDCLVRLHNVCEDAYWRANPRRTCPKCKTPWDGKHPVGQKVVTTTDEYLKAKRQSGGSKRTRQTQEDEEEQEEEEEEAESAHTRRSRPQEESNGGPSRRRKTRPDPDPEPESESEKGEGEEEEGEEESDDEDAEGENEDDE